LVYGQFHCSVAGRSRRIDSTFRSQQLGMKFLHLVNVIHFVHAPRSANPKVKIEGSANAISTEKAHQGEPIAVNNPAAKTHPPKWKSACLRFINKTSIISTKHRRASRAND
jgi:hypothetical protein